MLDLRCDHRLHARLSPDGLIEIKCKICQNISGFITFHYFHPISGELIRTETFADPAKLLKKSLRAHRRQ